ncbi:MauE/DoxX family redox-associated membrane protein [uncultured Chitinophaga sp.]|uniref:MauE/DoxX family redox-associated membrane protein n=1 Tax=uncultured Chitinophaga sp. TaxID=339340 RepID=UPI00261C0B16|nr:MauE/DoxX family redox-associated membrane protein [uncultured Chitinophaga sp.]
MIKTSAWKSRVTNLCLEVITSALVILWIYTSISKIFDYDNFKTQLGLSPFLEGMNGFIAVALPAGELLLALALIIRKTRKLGLYLSFGLMFLFTGYIWIMLHFAYDLPCSCGGVLAEMSWDEHLWFNAGMTLLAAIAIFMIEHKQHAASSSAAQMRMA